MRSPVWVRGAVSSVVEHCLHTAGVTGSKPVSPTMRIKGLSVLGNPYFFLSRAECIREQRGGMTFPAGSYALSACDRGRRGTGRKIRIDRETRQDHPRNSFRDSGSCYCSPVSNAHRQRPGCPPLTLREAACGSRAEIAGSADAGRLCQCAAASKLTEATYDPFFSSVGTVSARRELQSLPLRMRAGPLVKACTGRR
jgi:hypothetical protein